MSEDVVVRDVDEALEAVVEHDLEYPLTVEAVGNPTHWEVVDGEHQLEEAVGAALLASSSDEVEIGGHG